LRTVCWLQYFYYIRWSDRETEKIT